MAAFLTTGLSGPTPALVAAIQLHTEKNEPMSKMPGKGSQPFSLHDTVLSPVGCRARGIATRDSTSSAPVATDPIG